MSKAIRIPNVKFISGGIASRVLLDGRFNVTIFAVDKGQGLSAHSSNYPALIQVLSGSADIVIGTQKFKAKKGEIVYLPQKVSHSLKAGTKLAFLLALAK